MKDKMNPKNWCFTSWGEEIKFTKFNLCEFMIVQLEECPKTKRLHWQGYIEFKKEYKLFQVKSLFKEKGLDLRNAQESRERNIIYCSKNETYKGRRITYSDGIVDECKNEVGRWDAFNDIFDLE